MKDKKHIDKENLSSILHIPKENIDCPYNYSCLSNEYFGAFPQCTPNFPLNEKYLFINLKGPDMCPFRIKPGNTTACNCPFRIKLFQQYYL